MPTPMGNIGVSIPVQHLLLFTLLSLAASAQSADHTRDCNGDTAFRPGISPYQITSDTLKDLWSILAIPAKLRASSGIRFAAAPGEIDCMTGCESKVVSGDHFLSDGSDVVVRVCKHFDVTCRFLLLHQDSTAWTLVDYLDSPYEKYEAPKVRIEAAQDRRWLVKSRFAGGGTGVYLAEDDWFEIRCGSLQQVLTVLSRGDDVNARPARYFSTRFKGFQSQEGRESLEFGYVVLFQDYLNGRGLWQDERKVVFSRSDTNKPFTFDQAASDISATFKDSIFTIATLSERNFVEFAYDHLLEIAVDPADHRQDWLRRFLRELPDSEKVKTLKARLGERERIPPDRKP